MMKYSDKQLDLLRETVKEKLSEKRYIHTLGVEKMAIIIGEKCLPNGIDLLRAAALLHDISKEYSEAEHFSLMNKYSISMDDAAKNEPALWHSFSAPAAVYELFPEYADVNILSAVYNHTVGSPDMSIFDEIILLSDYIEENRQYDRCIALRNSFLAELNNAKNCDQAIACLHRAVVKSLDNNIQEFLSRGKSYHERTKLTRDAILAKIER